MSRDDSQVDNLHYIQEADHYEGYMIECAASRSKAEAGKWMGHFRARKEDMPTLRGSIANLQDTENSAREKAADIARAKIDEAVAAGQ